MGRRRASSVRREDNVPGRVFFFTMVRLSFPPSEMEWGGFPASPSVFEGPLDAASPQVRKEDHVY